MKIKTITLSKKHLIISATAFLASTSFAQFPLADAWMLNTDGTLAEYDFYPGAPPTTQHENMTDSADVLQICIDNDYVYIRANGLASYNMGPWEMNPNVPVKHENTYRFTRNPQEEMGAKEAQPAIGALGIAINGVKIYGVGDNKSYNSTDNENNSSGDGLWNGNAWFSEGETLDDNGLGHADFLGDYHYHATPIAFYSGTGHSPIIGYAFDGFPIYGPYGYVDPFDAGSGTERMETGYAFRSITDRSTLPGGATSTPPGPPINATFPLGTYWEDYEFTGAGDLDEYNGRWCVTPEYPDTIYAYFITQDASGEPEYPYIVGPEYFGSVISSEIGTASGSTVIPAGTSCDGGMGLNDENELSFEVYPNPANALLTVSGINGGTYIIFDNLGRQVDAGTNGGQINIEALTEGVYTLQLSIDNQSSFKRFVKK
ncbi:MAG: YHYH protein [Crocinitomicaceae bacterium]